MTTLITGGSKCGKSHLAEKILDDFLGRKIYIATMQPFGEEAFTAINRHRQMRAGKGFETVEKYTNLEEIILPENSAVLLECTANLCANEMFCGEVISDPTDKINKAFNYLKENTSELVVVTNDVGCDGIEYGEGTEKYIEVLGNVNRYCAELFDNVIECVYGIPVVLKGSLLC